MYSEHRVKGNDCQFQRDKSMLCVNIHVKNAQTQLEVEFGQSDQCAPLSPILWQHSFAFCEACVHKYSGTMSAMSDGHRFPTGVWLESIDTYNNSEAKCLGMHSKPYQTPVLDSFSACPWIA